MVRLFVYLLIIGCGLYFLWGWGQRQKPSLPGASGSRRKPRFRAETHPGEMWVQVYETATLEEGRRIQARLQEEELDCILYEQGKKDIHGNALPGIGVSVPKSLISRAQNIIARMPL